MEISVVVATYNRAELLLRTLHCLFDQEFPADQYEIIVVVDGSTDNTIQVLEQCRPRCSLRYCSQTNRGQAGARNVGIQMARGDLLLFLDDDLLAPPQLLRAHASAHRDLEPIVVFGSVLVSSESRPGLATEYTRLSGQFYEALERGQAPSWPDHTQVLPNSSVPRSLLLEVGGFDESFFRAHEDTELGIRLWKRGIRFTFLRRSPVYQIFLKNVSELTVEESELDGKSEVLLCEKHPEYRPHSKLVPPRKLVSRILLRLFLRANKVCRAALSALLRIVAPFYRSSLGRRFGLRIIELGRRAVLVGTACAKLGGVRNLDRDYWVRLPILMYHHVGPDVGLGALSVSPSAFAMQMKWLSDHGFQTITPSDWIGWCEGQFQLPLRPVIITFDDAYKDLNQYAFPLLRDYGFSATVFVVTEAIGGTNAWDRPKGFPAVPLLDRSDIYDWSQKGLEFGAHSRTHRDLSSCTSAELEEEVLGSARDLAAITGTPPTSFAYPYGAYNERVCEFVGRNFQIAFTVDPGLNDLGTDPHRQRRSMVVNGFAMRFRYRLLVGRVL